MQILFYIFFKEILLLMELFFFKLCYIYRGMCKYVLFNNLNLKFIMKIIRIKKSQLKSNSNPRVFIKPVSDIIDGNRYTVYDNDFIVVYSLKQYRNKNNSEYILHVIRNCAEDNNYNYIKLDSSFLVTEEYSFSDLKRSIKRIFDKMNITIALRPPVLRSNYIHQKKLTHKQKKMINLIFNPR